MGPGEKDDVVGRCRAKPVNIKISFRPFKRLLLCKCGEKQD